MGINVFRFQFSVSRLAIRLAKNAKRQTKNNVFVRLLLESTLAHLPGCAICQRKYQVVGEHIFLRPEEVWLRDAVRRHLNQIADRYPRYSNSSFDYSQVASGMKGITAYQSLKENPSDLQQSLSIHRVGD